MRLLLLLISAAMIGQVPLRVHPANARYYEFRGKPVVLIGSGEHYGALLNLDFDYVKYLDTLAESGLNLTRVFSGVYSEVPGDFGIAKNTLAPPVERLLTPYSRKSGKYDLTEWNPAYFQRLKSLMTEASKRGIVVEFVFFCVYYNDGMWKLSVYNPENQTVPVGPVKRPEALTLKHPKLVEAQERLIQKVTQELKDFDNLIYEICNEPYFARDIAAGEPLDAWQARMAKAIWDAETGLPARHLIAQNIANGFARSFQGGYTLATDNPAPHVSVLNFHYARPPVVVAQFAERWKGPIGYDETGFDGTMDAAYRIQAWEFLLAGGSHYSHLDYSFTADEEDGTYRVPGDSPGGGSPALRRQLKVLAEFLARFDLPKMGPVAADLMRIEPGPAGLSMRALGSAATEYAVYVHAGKITEDQRPRFTVSTAAHSVRISANLPVGRYRLRWIQPRSGKVEAEEQLFYDGGPTVFQSPKFTEDIALEIRRAL